MFENKPMQFSGLADGIGGPTGQSLGILAQQESPLMNLFREFAAVSNEFQEACHNLAMAQQRKAQAQSRLKELNAQLEKAVYIANQDPTVPQVECPMPTNGKAFTNY